MSPEEERAFRHQRALVARDDLRTAQASLEQARLAIVRAIGNIDDLGVLGTTARALCELLPVLLDVKGRAAELTATADQTERGL